METYEKFEKVKEHIGAETLLEHIYQWLPTSTMDEILEDAVKDYDLDYFFEEEFNNSIEIYK